MVNISLPTIPVIVVTALVDSVNPCAIGVLVLLIATLLKIYEEDESRNRMLKIGGIYISTVFIVYLAAGLGLLVFIQKLQISETLNWIVGILIIGMGLIEIKDFFWYGKGISLRIPKKRAKQIKKYMEEVSITGAIVLGAFVAAVELPCTGGPYLAITTLLAKMGFSLKVFWLLVLYNFIFVLPLIIILFLTYFGITTNSVKNWKDHHKKYMRLAMGIILVSLGVLMILWAQGLIGFSVV